MQREGKFACISVKIGDTVVAIPIIAKTKNKFGNELRTFSNTNEAIKCRKDEIVFSDNFVTLKHFVPFLTG